MEKTEKITGYITLGILGLAVLLLLYISLPINEESDSEEYEENESDYSPHSEEYESDYSDGTSYSSTSVDHNCGDFATQKDAQLFYVANGGPYSDPHDLDRDNDGNACDWNP